MKIRYLFILLPSLVLLLLCGRATAKSGVPFNVLTDVHWEEIELTFLGFCVCPRPPPLFFTIGEIWQYWEPFMVLATISEPFYSPFLGQSMGGGVLLDELGGKNTSSDSVDIANESTFAQAHAWMFPMMDIAGFCSRYDYGGWMTEYDPLWQNDVLSAIIHPEAVLFANGPMQMTCMADAAATNVGFPLDYLFWCIGSGGSSYPMTGHVDNDNIVQANNTAGSRLIYKLNRLFMICDPADNLCGCDYKYIWAKSHYKMHVVRPGDRRPAYPVGTNAEFYNYFLNTPFMGALGSNDEFMWVVYRKQFCCTCCD